MKVKDIPFGTINLFTLSNNGSRPFPDVYQAGTEIELIVSGSKVYLAPAGFSNLTDATDPDNLKKAECLKEQIVTVQCSSVRHSDFTDLLIRKWPRLCWIVDRPSVDDTLLVQIHEFVSRQTWDDKLQIGIDEELFEKQRTHRKQSVDQMCKWLYNKIAVEGTGDSLTPRQRFFLSSGERNQDQSLKSFRLHGPNVTIDVTTNDKGKLKVSSIVHEKRDRQQISLIEGNIQFCDITTAGELASSIRQQLEGILSGVDSYTTVWQNYSEFEQERILRMARDIGCLPYERYSRKLEGGITFNITDADTLGAFLEVVEKDRELEMEAGAELPNFQPPSARVRKSGRRDNSESFIGRCTPSDVDLSSGTVTLHGGTEYTPPQSGFIFVSLRGTQKAIDRRSDAALKIRSGLCPMPQLALLLEGQPVPIAERRWIEPVLTDRVMRLFPKGPPTSMQQKAIEIAINTPDIAIIQGPPGTGKTQVIAAIVKRLEELADTRNVPGGSFLLTSFQHVAVDNVAEKVTAYGLPTLKTGRRKDNEPGAAGQKFSDWRISTEQHISRQLEPLRGSSKRVLRAGELRRLVQNYAGGSHFPQETALTLRQAADMAKDLATVTACDELKKLADTIAKDDWSRNYLDNRQEKQQLAYRAVLALRYEAVPFLDDGPENATDALSRLRSYFSTEFPADIENLLESAGEWDTNEPPPFLSQLGQARDVLLGRLVKDTRPYAVKLAPRNDVIKALNKVVNEADQNLRGSGDGLEQIMEDYLAELTQEPAGLEEAVAHYTLVIAATCQGCARYEIQEMQRNWTAPGFETVVVDEAARANPLDLFIPMSQARRRIILVGDHNQLPHNLDPDIEKELEDEWDGTRKQLLKTSLFQRLYEEFEKRTDFCRVVLLDTQYRMHPKLGEFVSKNFYQDKLKSGAAAANYVHNLKRYRKDGLECVAAWLDVPYSHSTAEIYRKKSRCRPAEARRIVEEIELIRRENTALSIGVISFYGAQVQEVSEQLGKRKSKLAQTNESKLLDNVEIDTVDAFQGREYDVVFLSMTRSNDIKADYSDAQRIEKESYGELERLAKQESSVNSAALINNPKNGSLALQEAHETWQSCVSVTVEEVEQVNRKRYGFLNLQNRMCVALSRQKKLLIVVGDQEILRYPEVSHSPGILPLKNFLDLCHKEEYGLVI